MDSKTPRLDTALGAFLAPDALARCAEVLADAAKKKSDVRVTLIGGFAMQLYGSRRLTNGVDVVATRRFPPFDDGEPLPFGGVRVVVDEVETDIIVRSDKYADLYAANVDDPQRIDGLAIPVAPPEFLAAVKMAARRPIDHGRVVARFGAES